MQKVFLIVIVSCFIAGAVTAQPVESAWYELQERLLTEEPDAGPDFATPDSLGRRPGTVHTARRIDSTAMATYVVLVEIREGRVQVRYRLLHSDLPEGNYRQPGPIFGGDTSRASAPIAIGSTVLLQAVFYPNLPLVRGQTPEDSAKGLLRYVFEADRPGLEYTIEGRVEPVDQGLPETGEFYFYGGNYRSGIALAFGRAFRLTRVRDEQRVAVWRVLF